MFGAASIVLGAMWVLPLWSVTLSAPQYPEGLGMHIWLDTITGVKPNDLASINNLNHYIGMKRIEPDAIPELRLMPFVVGALIAVAGAVALTGRRWLGRLWIILFVAVAAAGLADFWHWTWDYGHNLDFENAIIKVPGMSYQPPIIGTRQLLNFRATSLPGGGALSALFALSLGVAALLVDRRVTGAVAVRDPALGAERA